MAPCKVSGCPALASNGDVCAVHRAHPEYRPHVPCGACGDTEQCPSCRGSGRIQEYGYRRTCAWCAGSGLCPECPASLRRA